MANNKGPHYTGDEILELLTHAKELKEFYDDENASHPNELYMHGGIANIALRLLERKHGLVVVGLRPGSGYKVNLHARIGFIYGPNENDVCVCQHTETCTLDDFTEKPIAVFVDRVHDILVRRANSAHPTGKDLKEIMLMSGSAGAQAARAKMVVKPYLPDWTWV